MTRYNSEANEPYVGMAEEHIPPEQLEGYQEGVDRVLTYIDSLNPQADTPYYSLLSELRWAIKEGII